MTILDVYQNLSEEQRAAVVREVTTTGRCSVSSTYMWLQGKRRPLPLYQDLILKALRRVGVNVTTRDRLFGKK